MKLLTFVVPSYNSEAYLHKCVESLLPAKESCEIIIVDDGSTDRTGEIADAYAAKEPDCVRVIHQPNGGHGSGINNGLKAAQGLYFKVIDSDDWADTEALLRVVETLGALEEQGGVDLMVCNYVYEYTDTGKRQIMRFGNALPEGRILSWSDTHHFYITQQLSLHSCIYRTETLRKSGVCLPEHVFYEDNMFVYVPLAYVQRLYYLNTDFYRYAIGRQGQSVAKASLIKHSEDQRIVSLAVFASHDVPKIKKENPKLGRYMHHSMSFLMMIAVLFTRIANTREADAQVKEFWKEIVKIDPKRGKRMKFFSRSGVFLLSLPGAPGRLFCRIMYAISHRVVRFN
ncbi:MAG: glycosyltransferase family 2 protein [Oscillospiraceae bacterium]|nr:glycosyltransferase family 2 protein [Oscillospiraceae bacterium]